MNQYTIYAWNLCLQEPKGGIKKSKTREQVKAVLFAGPEAKGPTQTPEPQTGQTHSSQSDRTGPDQQSEDETPREKPKEIENNLESYLLTEQCGEGASSNQETLNRSENLLQGSQTNETSQEPMQVDSHDIIVKQPENTSPESEGSVRSSSATDTASEMGNEMWSSGNSSTLVRLQQWYFSFTTTQLGKLLNFSAKNSCQWLIHS